MTRDSRVVRRIEQDFAAVQEAAHVESPRPRRPGERRHNRAGRDAAPLRVEQLEHADGDNGVADLMCAFQPNHHVSVIAHRRSKPDGVRARTPDDLDRF
jgi:hypothetical protein